MSRAPILSPWTSDMESFSERGRRDRGLESSRQYESNISRNEQWGSLAAGGALALYGLSRTPLWGLTSLVVGASLLYRGWTGHCNVYQRLGIDTSEDDRSRHGVAAQRGRKVKWAIFVNRDQEELYRYWRELSNLADVMRHLESVEPIDDRKSRWVAKGPMGTKLQWEAEIINEKPNELIAWQSLPGSQVATSGSVHFDKPAWGEGTVITVSLKYDPPGGAAVAKIANLLGQGLEQEIEEDLRLFKQWMEAGEVATAAQRPTQQTVGTESVSQV